MTAGTFTAIPGSQDGSLDERRAFFYGTRDPLEVGQRIGGCHTPDHAPDSSSHALVEFSRSLDDAIWMAELAAGDGPGRVYVVEPTGPVEESPHSILPGAPGTASTCSSREPVVVTGEVTAWPLYHGTRADLRAGDLIEPGRLANYGNKPRTSNHVYFSRTLNAAIWGAELARGDGRPRVYRVEPTGPFEDDPNLTDKKFRGNPTKSFRSRCALRVASEVSGWRGHAPEAVQARKDGLARLQELEADAIDD